MKLIFGGHWKGEEPGWTIVPHSEQDIRFKLKYEDNSIEAIFTEHVIEHVGFFDAIHFMNESLRILKPGGVFRCVTPTVDKILKVKAGPLLDKYMEQLHGYYKPEDAVLNHLGIGNGISHDPFPFFVDNLVRRHGHQFIWSIKLMKAVLIGIGFRECGIWTEPGFWGVYGTDWLIERKIRGIYDEEFIKKHKIAHYDPEGNMVEAIK